MEQILNELQNLKSELAKIKKQLEEYENCRHFDNWIPRKKLMEFFDYGDTKIAALFKNENLIVSEVGNRKFIRKESVLKLLEKSITSKK